MNPTVQEDSVLKASQFVPALVEEIGKVLVGQAELVESLLLAVLTGGHVLLEGVPGLAKTLAVRTLAQTLDLESGRIQFTPDLLPADLLGTPVYNPGSGEFIVQKGPVFTNILHADEINRAPAKVQSALLEAMEEQRVTIGGHTYDLPRPFLVLATQNPIEQEGTYSLPEAQVDRFLMKVILHYPSREEEALVVDRAAGAVPPDPVHRIVGSREILEARDAVRRVHVEPSVRDYCLDLVAATRDASGVRPKLADYIAYGASPRASVNLVLVARARALLQERDHVTPSDVQHIAPRVLRHRLILSYEGLAEAITSDEIVSEILGKVAVP